MRSLTRWILTETPRSAMGHFINDSLNGVMYACVLLMVCLLSTH